MKKSFSDQGYIKDVRADEDTVYFVTDRDISYDEIERDPGDERKYVRIPSFLCPDAGEGFFSSEDFEELRKALEEKGVAGAGIKLSFTDREKGFSRKAPGGKGKKGTLDMHSGKSSDPACVFHGPLDWDEAPYASLRELLKERKDSLQKLIYIKKGLEEETTYGELYTKACRMAAAMKMAGMGRGDKAVFQFSYKRNFIECYWACTILGVGVVPVNKPASYGYGNVDTEKLVGIARSFGRTFILAEDESRDDLLDLVEENGLDCTVLTSEELGNTDTGGLEDRIYEESEGYGLEEPCVFLFTSGSTGQPKGVGLCTRNMFARNLGEIQMYGLDGSLSDLNWMTLTHAAGLIWSHVRDIQLDAFQVQVETDVILQDPLKLLQLMDRFGSTTSWAPNFAYPLVAGAMDEDEDYGWDLSKATNIYSGGEMNVSRSLRSFLRKTEKYGFPEKGLIPCFGMTETSSCVTYENRFSLKTYSDSDRYVAIGTPCRGMEARIADRDNNVLSKGDVGYLQVKGDPVIKNYYDNPEADARSFSPDGFLITGDLAYIEDDEVVITGREKDIIIVNGENHYIQDLEETADDIDEVETGFTSVIAAMEEDGEKVLLFFTPKDENLMRADSLHRMKALVKKIKKEVQTKCFVTLDHIVPLSHREFPRSEIGKKQRGTLTRGYDEGAYEEIIRNIEDLKTEYAMKPTLMPLEIQGRRDEEAVIDMDLCSDTSRPADMESIYRKITGLLMKYEDAEEGTRVIIPLVHDHSFDMEGAVLQSMTRTFSLEKPGISFKVLFMDDMDMEKVRAEASSADRYETVWYRDGKRYIEGMSTISASCDRDRAAAITGRGIVLVLGGAGGIGRLLCSYLLDTYEDVKVAATGRRDVSFTGMDEDRFMYIKADICSSGDLEAAAEAAKERWDLPVSCMFNLTARAVPKEEEMTIPSSVRNGRMDIYLESAAVKLEGLMNADRLRKRLGCRMYVFGSVAGDFGMVNMAPYASSSMLAERYCRNADDEDLVFIAWSGWSDTGMNLKKSSAEMKSFIDGFDMDRNGFMQGFTRESGIKMMDTILCTGAGTCYAGIDTGFSGIQYMCADRFLSEVRIVVSSEEDMDRADEAIALLDNTDRNIRMSCMVNRTGSLRDSEDISGFRTSVKRIWQDALGMDDISPDDNLFDIGGNSLTVFRIVSDMKDEMSLEVKPVDIMMYSTVASFTDHITSSGDDEGDRKADGRKRKLKKREKAGTHR